MENFELKYIEHEAHAVFDGFAVRITKQSHICEKFGENDDVFIASDGTCLRSAHYPTRTSGGFELQGNSKEYNNDAFFLTKEQYGSFKKAVAEYNATFGTRPVGSIFWCKHAFFEVVETEYPNPCASCAFDISCYTQTEVRGFCKNAERTDKKNVFFRKRVKNENYKKIFETAQLLPKENHKRVIEVALELIGYKHGE